MLMPGRYTESEALVAYVDEQLEAIRTAVHGLTDDQARLTPCRSALSVGGLVKHATYVMQVWAERRAEPGRLPDAAGFARYGDSFTLGPDETLASALAAFDEARTAYLADLRTVDPAAPVEAPAAPWNGIDTPLPSVERFELLHHVEEFARHAGHADVLREQIDGAQSGSLWMAVQGIPGNDFMQPWTPATSPATS